MPVVNYDPDAGDGEFEFGSLFHASPEPLLTGGDKLGWNGATDDLVVEDEISFGGGFQIARHPAELTGASGLLLVGVIEFRLLGDGFPIGHPGISRGYLGVVFPAHALHVNLQVQLTHPGNDGFVCLMVHMGTKGGILPCKTPQGLGHVDLCLVVLGTIASEITGSGTNMDDMARFVPGDANVSPEAHSTPKRAPMYPAGIASMSSI
jgi:hypothetical protein